MPDTEYAAWVDQLEGASKEALVEWVRGGIGEPEDSEDD